METLLFVPIRGGGRYGDAGVLCSQLSAPKCSAVPKLPPSSPACFVHKQHEMRAEIFYAEGKNDRVVLCSGSTLGEHFSP